MMRCPDCNSENIVRNGSNSTGKQKFMCKDCGRQFVENPENRIISQMVKSLIDDLLLEKLSLAGITRVTKVSKRWLQYYANEKYENVPKEITVKNKEKGRLTIACDEMWSFVGNSDNKVWIWLAKDVDTKEIIGVYAGSRDRKGAQGLWDSFPGVYRQCAVSYTDFWSSYEEVFPYKRHRPVDKRSGRTDTIESFNCKSRQRISRPVRKRLSHILKK
jgi:insertion element IS1 protein InsB